MVKNNKLEHKKNSHFVTGFSNFQKKILSKLWQKLLILFMGGVLILTGVVMINTSYKIASVIIIIIGALFFFFSLSKIE